MAEAMKALPDAPKRELLAGAYENGRKTGAVSFASTLEKVFDVEFAALGTREAKKGRIKSDFGLLVSEIVKCARSDGVGKLSEKERFEWLSDYFTARLDTGWDKDRLLSEALLEGKHNDYSRFIVFAGFNERIGKPAFLVIAKSHVLLAGYSHCLDLLASGNGQVFPIRELYERYPESELRPIEKILAITYDRVASVYMGRGDVASALNCGMAAMNVNPTDSRAPYNLGRIYQKLGDVKEADKWLGRAVTANPENADAWYRRGYINVSLGNSPEAIHCFETAIKLSPGSFGAENQLCTLYLGEGDYDAALEHGMKALKLNPENAVLNNNVGVAYHNNNEPQAAIGFLQEAVRLDPEFASAHQSLGTIYNGMGLKTEATYHFHKSAELKAKALLPKKPKA